MRVPVNLSQKIGPLPVGAWLGIGAAGLFLLRKGSPSTSSDAAPAVDSIDGSYQLPASYSPSLSSDTPGLIQPGDPQSNADWVRNAAKLLVAQGQPWSSFAIVQALNKYVTGGYSFTPTEQAIIEKAQRVAGIPPEAVPIAEPTSPGATSVKPAGEERTPPNLVSKNLRGKRRTSVRKIGNRGERSDEIARRVYGSSMFANFIRWYNPQLSKRPDGRWRAYTEPLPVGAVVAY